MQVTAIVSVHHNTRGIGRGNSLPWRLKEDMTFFRETTSSTACGGGAVNAVLMGRKTWESLPAKFRPLPGRLNVVLSKSHDRESLALPDDVLLSSSLETALQTVKELQGQKVAQVFVIGGETIYRTAMDAGLCDRLLVTEVYGEVEGLDSFFPTIAADRFRLIYRSERKTEGDLSFAFTEYEALPEDAPIPRQISRAAQTVATGSANPEELQYLQTVKDILENGVVRGDRTGTGTISKFGVQMRFSLRGDSLPLITTKRVFWRGVAEELLWFVAGSTNANLLRDKKIHIWDGNASREFLDSRGLQHREEGDLGPVYGFQWRHFGATYKDMHADYTGQGIDQLRDCIDKIKHNPEDRRILLTAWNPADLHLMALPPCHMFCQFYVANGELSCQMYQRSADMGLGVPFNIASYALLTYMVAHVCGLKPGDFVHSIGDAHVYLNHVDALKTQIQREPKPFPKLFIDRQVSDIDGFQFSDFRVEGYNPDAAIKMAMAV